MAVINNAYAFRMPAGIPGTPNREWEHTGEPNQLDATLVPGAYGDAVKMGSNGRIQALASGDAAAAVYGFLERAFPGQAGTTYGATTQLLGASAPPAAGRCTVMKRGYMSVLVQGATVPAKGGAVYIRLGGTVPAGGRLNGLEAAPDSTNTVLIPNCYWMGAPDANGNSEIAFNL